MTAVPVLVSAPDVWGLTDPPDVGLLSGNYQTFGLSQKLPTLVDGENTVVIIAYGQSLMANHNNDSYTAIYSLNQQFCIGNGGVYGTSNPNLSASFIASSANYASYLTRVGDKLIDDGYCHRVIICNVASASSYISQWAVGGVCNERLRVAALRLIAAGFVPNSLFKTFVVQHQGENHDPVSAAAYTASGNSALATVRSNGFPSAKAFIALASWVGGDTSSTIRAGQAGMVNDTDTFQGPDLDTLNNAYRIDGTHLNSAGCVAAADAWAAILEGH